MAARKQVACIYNGDPRELCPHILGYNKDGEEAALAIQFGGKSKGRALKKSQWRCMRLSKVRARP